VEGDADLVNACLCHLVKVETKGNKASFAWRVGEEFVLSAITKAMTDLQLKCPQMQLFDDLVSTLGVTCSAKGNVWELILAQVLKEVNIGTHQLFQGLKDLPSWWKDVGKLQYTEVCRQGNASEFPEFLAARDTKRSLLPSQMAGPDHLTFMNEHVVVSTASKLEGNNVDKETHAKNTKTSDPTLCYTDVSGISTTHNCEKLREASLKALGLKYKGALRFVVSLPGVVRSTVQEPTVRVVKVDRRVVSCGLREVTVPTHFDVVVVVDSRVLEQLAVGTSVASSVSAMLEFLFP
jgi:hypothetical protein